LQDFGDDLYFHPLNNAIPALSKVIPTSI
jgi:hypothetical protein